MSGYEIYCELRDKNLLINKPKYWWPNAGSVWCLISTILTQNTKWQNVTKSMSNLSSIAPINLEMLLDIPQDYLATLIAPSGFKNQKSHRLKLLAHNIINDFGDFETFKDNVERDWLLAQKGIGFESADSILCYVCFKEVMVVDKYTQRLLSAKGLEFEEYHDLQGYLQNEIIENWGSISQENENNLNLCFARFHGMIVEFMKK
ncbi:MAG: 3-methyladenine DNA glycosylase [Epsilonproteobacteria bacterium]|nr:3-methyladenine DNA glycosylase [Campylobacterota bacterium]